MAEVPATSGFGAGARGTGTRVTRMLLERMKQWKVWELDGEMRYSPVVAALPDLPLPICEVGSGPEGLAAWTTREVIGIDPGPDDRHGEITVTSNFRRFEGDGAHIPLADRSVAAAVSVDTFEHIPRPERAVVVAEMKRVIAPGGRLIIIGPTGAGAAEVDAQVLARWQARGMSSGVVVWLSEHQSFGLPSVDELVGYVGEERVKSISVRGVFSAKLWLLMHRALLGDFSRSKAMYLMQLVLTQPFAALARRWRRGPFYRFLIVAELA